MPPIALLFAGLIAFGAASHAQTSEKPAPQAKGVLAGFAPPARPQGVYATIDLRSMNEITSLVVTQGKRKATAREVLKNPGSSMPPVLYAVANLLSDDQPDTAIF